MTAMDEQRLWAPWRLSYITGDGKNAAPAVEPSAWRDGADRGCFLCQAAASYADDAAARRQNRTVAVGQHTVALLNRYPYNNGHLLVAPCRHVAELADLSTDEHLEAMTTLSRFTQLYARLIKAEGFNVGLNLGRVAGAGVPGHLHWHLVPRWTGDNNSMPAIANTRVISQSLDALWEAVTEATREWEG
jgi:ATP adenylyltransferase